MCDSKDPAESTPESPDSQAPLGSDAERDQLWSLLYDRMLAIARKRHRDQGHTLQPTAIVHEAFLKVAGHEVVSPARSLALAVVAMRQVMIDAARARNAAKRGGDRARVPLSTSMLMGTDQPLDVIELDDLIRRLGEHDARSEKVVMYRLYGGLSNGEIAGLLDVSEKTVRNEWRHAMAWLKTELSRGE